MVDAHAGVLGKAVAVEWHGSSSANGRVLYGTDGSEGRVYQIGPGAQTAGLCLAQVISDIGVQESVVGLAGVSVKRPSLWLGLHEHWTYDGSRYLCFKELGLRVYFGTRDAEGSGTDLRQLLRAEWLAPEIRDGFVNPLGAHAGHPHWHIDHLVVNAGLPSLQLQWEDEPRTDEDIRDFEPAEARRNDEDRDAHIDDCAWLQRVHFPAQTNWCEQEWTDTVARPFPHQKPPASLVEVQRWALGVIRYLRMELSAFAPAQ